jgi:hypothetical protein
MIMNRGVDLTPGEPSRAVDRRIRRALEKRQAMSVKEIGRLLALEAGVVEEGLRHLVGAGEVERLRPVAYFAEDHDFYRLRRVDDRAFLWEQRYRETGRETPLDPRSLIRQAHWWMDLAVF